MRIHVYLDSARLFRWHIVLIERLSAQGHKVTVSFEDTSDPLPASLTVLFDYDRARSGATNARFSTRMSPEAFRPFSVTAPGSQADIAIDLATSLRVTRRPERVLRPLYDGGVKDYALFHALLDQRAPELSVFDSSSDDYIWTIGLPAIEMPWRVATSFDQVTSRLVEGLLGIADKIRSGQTPRDLPDQNVDAGPDQRPSILTSAGHFVASCAARKLTRAREKISGDLPKWHVAWRTIPDGAMPTPATYNLSAFRILEDDGQRFFADPFVLLKNGERHVFIEEFPYSTGRGIISHFTISPEGIASPPRPVLETPFHLSYPFVFEHGGETWMMPESSTAGGLDLFRAERFPDRWIKEARIIEGRINDPTLFSHGGLLWIAAGNETLQSTTWDGLSLYSAANLHGPWEPHPQNPVLIDARAARPAGALWTADGELYRPAQDCSKAYGGRLTLRRVTELSRERFREETVGTISFGLQGPILGPHTMSRAGTLEVIDFYAKPSVLRAR